MELSWANVGAAVYRTAILWAVALIVFRLTGKRTLGKLAAFDFAVIIMMGEAVAIGMEDAKMPLVYPILIVCVLGLLQWLLTFANVRFRPLEQLTQGQATKVIDNGRMDKDAMVRERFSEADLRMELRQNGVDSVDQVKEAYLEPTGKLSVFKKNSSPTKSGN
jgi:uncharacterized membrane protein YcaP (DUF421 family)